MVELRATVSFLACLTACAPELAETIDTTTGSTADTVPTTFTSLETGTSTSPSPTSSTSSTTVDLDTSTDTTAAATSSDEHRESASSTTDATSTSTADPTSSSADTSSSSESSTTGPPPDPVCGNLYLEGDELCDDGNAFEYDGCTSECTLSERSISAGGGHTCSTNQGALRCWGATAAGVLGVAFHQAIGDDEPASVGVVDAGGPVVQVAAGFDQTCVLLVGGDVRCWGEGAIPFGEVYGDDEPASEAPLVDLGGRAVSIAAWSHACALLEGGTVRCWGFNFEGELGYGHTEIVSGPFGPSPAEAGDVEIGGEAVALWARGGVTCVLLSTDELRCWGVQSQVLGHVGGGPIGDDEVPSSAPILDVGGTPLVIAPSVAGTCALLQDGNVRCIGGDEGSPTHGINGLGGPSDGPTFAETGPVPLDMGGALAIAISTATFNATAVLDDGTVRAWGAGWMGEAGYGPLYPEAVGDTETPADVGPVPIGGSAVATSTGEQHSCVILDTLAIRCWGASGSVLGFGSYVESGWAITPAEAGDVPVW
jgi:cysteine-rich repeat protein